MNHRLPLHGGAIKGKSAETFHPHRSYPRIIFLAEDVLEWSQPFDFPEAKAWRLLRVDPEPFDFPQGHEQVEWRRYTPV